MSRPGLSRWRCSARSYMLGELTATPVVPWQSRTLYTYPFVGDWLSFYFWLVAGGLAIALGLRQTAWEARERNVLFSFASSDPSWPHFRAQAADRRQFSDGVFGATDFDLCMVGGDAGAFCSAV